ncbi:toll/interleukin-1 receptor domain-containing protein [Corallococcus exiguus]|uniref:TIR domain-containing protein n=1 Tax=Corallococcus exiguus TaxID=83462 RepID=A0A7X4Y680_9BACT|nr:toll/interleukin-1 receptor domain-containing protein [Corallococcus exiguus]NBC39639.1 TIR domain-containing protein [Corallococcus exiguus]TNV63291.1 toll/interleukin-1 receptor domain-containing protein [Corallococcus exiguus]
MSSKSPNAVTPEPVFISHSSVDGAMANYFVEQLLVAGAGLSASQIFCTSAASSPISAGTNFNPRIRQAISHSRIVIALVSRNYYRSPFCMSELGAAWAAEKLLPILVPPVDFGDLEGVLHGVHCLRLEDERKIFEIYDRLREANWHRPNPAGVYAAKVKEFLAGLGGQLAKLPSPDVVDRSEYKKLENQVEELTSKLKASIVSAEGLRAAAKPAVLELARKVIFSVPPIAANGTTTGAVKPSGGDTEFSDLVERVSRIGKTVPSVIFRMVYARAVGSEAHFRVFESEAADWEAAVDQGLVRPYDDGEFYLNFQSARVSQLHEALRAVDDFWAAVDVEYRLDYEVSCRHIPSIREIDFSRKWFGFWWEEDPEDIPF